MKKTLGILSMVTMTAQANAQMPDMQIKCNGKSFVSGDYSKSRKVLAINIDESNLTAQMHFEDRIPLIGWRNDPIMGGPRNVRISIMEENEASTTYKIMGSSSYDNQVEKNFALMTIPKDTLGKTVVAVIDHNHILGANNPDYPISVEYELTCKVNVIR